MSKLELFMVGTTHLDQAIDILKAHKDEWALMPMEERIPYYEGLVSKTAAIAEDWVFAAAKAKSIPTDSPLVGEEWSSGPWAFIYGVDSILGTLRALSQGKPPPIGKVRERSDGQIIANIFPYSIYHRLLLNGIRGEVWMQSEVTRENLHDNMAVAYKNGESKGQLSLVLGAGNVTSIPSLDVLDRLFAHKSVCLLKLHPVNDYLEEFFLEIFQDFISAGFVQIVTGGADIGKYLCGHEYVDHIHITGGDKTYEAIVYGPGPDGQSRKERDEPITNKSMTAELGCVSPVIVVPGPWSEADIKFQAENIASQKMHNGGFNCIASQILVLPGTWDRSKGLLDSVRSTIESMAPREPYYTGAGNRYDAVKNAYPNGELLDEPGECQVPRMLITGLDADDREQYVFNKEVFVGVLGQTALPGADAGEFLQNAVQFCNEKLWGTLGASIIIHPKTMKELGAEFEDAIGDLRYGAIGVNAWCALAFLTAESTWGAFPGHVRSDIQSGTGVVHNSRLFEKPEKTVVYAPFTPFPRNLITGEMHMFPKPPWFVKNKQAHNVSKRFTYFQAKPGPMHLPGLFFYALRG